MAKTAILYIRVSTDEQAKSGYSIPEQLRELRRYAGDNGYDVLAEEIDDGYSGASPDRPGLNSCQWSSKNVGVWSLKNVGL